MLVTMALGATIRITISRISSEPAPQQMFLGETCGLGCEPLAPFLTVGATDGGRTHVKELGDGMADGHLRRVRVDVVLGLCDGLLHLCGYPVDVLIGVELSRGGARM
jgi:hypothetical protein